MNNKIIEEKKEEKSFIQKIVIRKKLLRKLLEKLGYLKGDEILGLDIGHSSVKVVQLERGKDNWRIVKVDMEEVSPWSETEEKKDITSKAKEAIQSIIDRQKIKVKKAVSGVSGKFVKERTIRLPRMKKKELKDALFWEARKDVDWPSEKIVLDYYLNEEAKDSNEICVFLAITQRDMIEKHLSFIRDSGLIPYGVESKASALNACLKETKVIDNNGPCALLDIGARSSFLVISENGLLRFSREIKIAGDEITHAISNQIKCDLDFAERIKKRNFEAVEKIPDGHMILNAIQQQLDRLANEVNRSFGYFRAENPQKDVAKLFLTGGTSKLEGVEKFFENQLKVRTKRFNPIEEILALGEPTGKEFLNELAPHLTLAFGLATWRKK